MSALRVLVSFRKKLLMYTLFFSSICILILFLYLWSSIGELHWDFFFLSRTLFLPIVVYSFTAALVCLLLKLSDEQLENIDSKILQIIKICTGILFFLTVAFTAFVSVPIFNEDFDNFIFYENVNADISHNKILIEGDTASTIIFINLTNYLDEAQKDVIINVNFDEYVTISEDISCNQKTKPFTVDWTDNITKNNVGIRTEYISPNGERFDFSMPISWDANQEIPSGLVNVQVNSKFICNQQEIKLD